MPTTYVIRNFNVGVRDVMNIHDMFGVPYNRPKNDLNDKFVLVKKWKKLIENVMGNIWGQHFVMGL